MKIITPKLQIHRQYSDFYCYKDQNDHFEAVICPDFVHRCFNIPKNTKYIWLEISDKRMDESIKFRTIFSHTCRASDLKLFFVYVYKIIDRVDVEKSGVILPFLTKIIDDKFGSLTFGIPPLYIRVLY